MSNKSTNNKKKGNKKYTQESAKKSINNKYSGKASDPRDEKSKSKEQIREEKSAHYDERRGRNILNMSNADGNDPQWYLSCRKLVEDATKVSFGAQTGIIYNMGDYKSEFTDPGICVLHTQVTPGICKDSTDAGNMSAIQTYEYVRKYLGTISEYTSADFFMRNYGIMNAFALYCHIMRAFGSANLYSATNMYYPRDLLKAVYGWNESAISDFIDKGANYMYKFNNIITKLSALYMPMDFTFMQRYAWLFLNYWNDHDTRKAQIYAHTPEYLYELDETYSENGTCLRPVKIFGLTPTQLLDLLNEMIERYRQSTSMQRIQADMERAFEQRSAWKLAYCDSFFMSVPGHSDEVLSQMENATIVPFNRSEDFTTEWTILQDVDHDIAIFDPKLDIDYFLNLATPIDIRCNIDKTILNMHWDSPSLEDVVVATRNKLIGYEYAEEDTHYLKFNALPSDVITDAVYFDKTNMLESIHIANGLLLPYESAGIPGILLALRAWSVFDWAPTIEVGIAEDYLKPVFFGEIDNFAVLDEQVLTNIHTAVDFSMWSIPEMGLIGT